MLRPLSLSSSSCRNLAGFWPGSDCYFVLQAEKRQGKERERKMDTVRAGLRGTSRAGGFGWPALLHYCGGAGVTADEDLGLL